MYKPSAKLIAASAGSGKTFQLTKRYIELLMNGNDISTILAITFTENAAKEMKDRINLSLKEIALNIPQSERRFRFEFKDHEKAILILDKIFERYNQFNIKTIDSFITSIFSSSSFEFGYDFDFSIKFNYTKIIEKEIFNFISKKISDGETQDIDKFIEFLNQTENISIFDPTYKIIDFFSEFSKKEDDYISEIKSYRDDQKTKFRNKLKEIEKIIIEELENLIRIYDENLFYKDIVNGFKDKDIKTITKTAVSKETVFKKEELKNTKKDLKIINLSKEYIKLHSKIFYLPYSELYCQFRQYFKNSQKNSNEVILSSMIKEIYKVLNNSPELFIHDTFIKLSSVFKHFLIDEFQDTSYAQWSIIRPFVEEALSRGGSLFLIGDIKQAIYMFRNADYRIMKDIIENPKQPYYLTTLSLENGIEVKSIGLNYRSSQPILEYVNNIFLSEEFKEYLKNEGIETFKEIYSIEHKSNEPKDGYVKTSKIEELELKDKLTEIISDLKTRMPLSSIAILTYRNDTLDKIAQWLGEEKIPVISYGELDIRKNPTVKAILTILKFLNNPRDEFSFSISMLMPQITKNFEHICSTRDIESVFIEANIEEISKIELIKKRYPQIWTIFEELIKEVFKRDIYYLTNFVISKLNITQNFPQDSAYILKLLDVIINLINEENIYSLNDFIDFIENADYEDERFSAEISQTINAIKLLTFHKSKGLEFDAVINIFWSSQKGGSKMYYELDGDEIKIYALNKEILNADEKLKKIYFSNNINEKIADINILYVALTRARKELYNLVVKTRNPPKILSLLNDWEKGKKITIEQKSENVDTFEAIINRNFEKKSELEILENVKRDIGNIYHNCIYQVLLYKTEIDKAIKNAFIFEDLTYKKSLHKKIQKMIIKTLKNEKLSKIINSSKLLPEVEFSDENGNIMRADLLAISKEKIYVIDFKTGEKNSNDIKQISKYIMSLKKIYREKIIGIIYYVKEDEIVEIDNLTDSFKQEKLWKEL